MVAVVVVVLVQSAKVSIISYTSQRPLAQLPVSGLWLKAGHEESQS